MNEIEKDKWIILGIKLLLVGGIIILMISATLLLSPLFSDFQITNLQGNETDFLIKIVDCTPPFLLNETSLIPKKYQDRETFFGEQINSTHGKLCWYDVFNLEDLNSTWLNENCQINSGFFRSSYDCDKGFKVN